MSDPTGPAAPLVDDYQWSGWFDKTTTNHLAAASALPGSTLTGPIQGDWISFGESPSVITNGNVANGALVAGRVSFTYNEKINIASNVNLSSIKIRGTGGFDNNALFLVKPDTTPSGATNWIRTTAGSGAGMNNDAAATLMSLDGDTNGLGFYYGPNTIGLALSSVFAADTQPSNVIGVIADFEITADCLDTPAPQPTEALMCPAGNVAGDTVRIGPFTTNARDWKWTWRNNAGTLENVEQPLYDSYRYRSYFDPSTLAQATAARWISPGTTDPAGTDIPGVPYPSATGQAKAGFHASVFQMNQPITVGNNVDLASIKLDGRFGFDDYGNTVFVQPVGGAAVFDNSGLYMPNGYGSFSTATTPAIPGFQQGQNTIGFMLDGGQNTNDCNGGTCALAAIADFYVTATCTGADPVVTPPTADLSITNTNGATSVTPGSSVTYTVTASNAGPAGVTGATVTDTLPAALTNATWTCTASGGGTCTASGSGSINDTVNLPMGASVTYTVKATVASTATGTLSSTATIAAPAGMTDPTPANNSATDSDTVATGPIAGAATPVPVMDLAGLSLLGLLSAGIGAAALRRRQRVN
ncbi:DUF11 domain-containing protein [Diaphorobacter ruginosibacter]|uniref:DUF11 domain-containing protein n=1 Tax=Diaphorobacter ruginosibacter TaxID=1715720 RepID=A0A7G9RJE3_9BURK|nr:DUF11 domain-containing protein [Diaphorobacter ruginosibacter]QNN55718.1 DUF11 domain-containing protein [Diaphorobacter ruginosibacter]